MEPRETVTGHWDRRVAEWALATSDDPALIEGAAAVARARLDVALEQERVTRVGPVLIWCSKEHSVPGGGVAVLAETTGLLLGGRCPFPRISLFRRRRIAS